MGIEKHQTEAVGRKDHEKLYSDNRDTWTLPENFDQNPRARAVLMVREQLLGPDPVSVLDIGCGKATNTKWIADQNDGSSWTGVDIVSKETIGLSIPDDDKHKFFEGDILSGDFRTVTGIENQKFDLIVDQGAAFCEIDDPKELENYLELAHNLLSERGVFLILTLIGKSQTVFFPDGRKRVIHEMADFQKEPFNKYFNIDDELLENPFLYGGHSYAPMEIFPKNPLGAHIGNETQMTLASIPLKKKLIPAATS